jgi:hypothetical protein
MNVDENIPAVRYEWQRPYLAAALEIDSQRLPAKISEARSAIRSRLSDGASLDASERSAAADALNALTTLEKERLNVEAEERPIVFLDLSDAGSEPSAA